MEVDCRRMTLASDSSQCICLFLQGTDGEPGPVLGSAGTTVTATAESPHIQGGHMLVRGGAVFERW